ncbi:MAG TPA: hypothetical protein PK857_01405 [Hyphomicrobium sp.]|nr:hypothetical protein [Hyphomicrobium sp.]HRO49450.1 hypothetical protein [Hyphomicrobium sp.]
MMRRALRPVFAAFCAIMLSLPSAGAEEGRFCGDAVESGRSSGDTREEAETKAKGWWSSRAGTSGRGYEHWEHARDRSVECTADNAGKFYCKAKGRPCLPPGTLPDNVPKIEM